MAKKNFLKSNSFGVMQTVFFAFTCRFGLCLHVEKVVICINETNCCPLVPILLWFLVNKFFPKKQKNLVDNSAYSGSDG